MMRPIVVALLAAVILCAPTAADGSEAESIDPPVPPAAQLHLLSLERTSSSELTAVVALPARFAGADLTSENFVLSTLSAEGQRSQTATELAHLTPNELEVLIVLDDSSSASPALLSAQKAAVTELVRQVDAGTSFLIASTTRGQLAPATADPAAALGVLADLEVTTTPMDLTLLDQSVPPVAPPMRRAVLAFTSGVDVHLVAQTLENKLAWARLRSSSCPLVDRGGHLGRATTLITAPPVGPCRVCRPGRSNDLAPIPGVVRRRRGRPAPIRRCARRHRRAISARASLRRFPAPADSPAEPRVALEPPDAPSRRRRAPAHRRVGGWRREVGWARRRGGRRRRGRAGAADSPPRRGDVAETAQIEEKPAWLRSWWFLGTVAITALVGSVGVLLLLRVRDLPKADTMATSLRAERTPTLRPLATPTPLESATATALTQPVNQVDPGRGDISWSAKSGSRVICRYVNVGHTSSTTAVRARRCSTCPVADQTRSSSSSRPVSSRMPKSGS
jgi:hypothetical protein